MMENEIEESLIEYTDEFKKELDSRYADFKNGKVKIVTAEQSKKRIQKFFKGGSKKWVIVKAFTLWRRKIINPLWIGIYEKANRQLRFFALVGVPSLSLK